MFLAPYGSSPGWTFFFGAIGFTAGIASFVHNIPRKERKRKGE